MNSILTKKSSDLVHHTSMGDWAQRELTHHFFDVLAHFLLSLRSPHTRRNYGRDIDSFITFCQQMNIEIQDIRDVKEKIVLLWVEALQKQHSRHVTLGSTRRIVQTSVARHLCSLSSLLEFAKRRKLITDNCMDLIQRPRIKRESHTDALTGDETQSLLTLAEKHLQDASPGSRQAHSALLRYSILATLLTVGMRVDELCELRIGDLMESPDAARLRLTTKGGEEHIPIIHPSTAQVLRHYIQIHRSNKESHDYLFVRVQKTAIEQKITQSAVYLMIAELCKEAGITKKIGPHSCRATLATLLHLQGVPIGHIQNLLNHKQITTTALYIKKAEEVKEAAALKIDLLKNR